MNLSTKKLFTILIMLLLISALVLGLAACNPDLPDPEPEPEPEEEDVAEDTSIIQNGDFHLGSGETYPLTPDGWTSAPGAAAGSKATPSGPDNVLGGIINTETEKYNQNKHLWDDLANPGAMSDNNNVLMIYNKVETSYRYHRTFSVEAGKYYKVNIPVKTILQEGSGAFIYLSGAAYSFFDEIDTQGVWDEYAVYIEGSLISNQTVTINLSLGYGATDSGHMTQGYAFFDNVVAEEIDSEEYDSQTMSSKSSTYTMRVPDSRMEYTTGTTQPFTPYGYSSKTGTGAGGQAPYYSTDVKRGVVDTANWNDTFGENPGIVPNTSSAYGSKVLMIQNKNASAAGYAGTRPIRFSIGGYYMLSLDVYIDLDLAEEESDEFKGVTLALTGTDDFKIQYIGDTQGNWVKYFFYIEANEVRNKDMTLEMWLGQGGKDDTDTLTKGIAFFDNIELTEIEESIYNEELSQHDEDPENYPNYIASLKSTNPNLISNNNLDLINENGLPVGWIEETTSKDVIVNEDDISYEKITEEDLALDEWTDTISDKYLGLANNPKAPYDIMAPVFMIKNNIPIVSGLGLENSLDIMPNLHYRLAVWLKTVDIEEGKGITIKLINDDGDTINTLSSFETINTAEYESPFTNDYMELVFLVQGHEFEQNNLRLLIEIGSGTRYDPTKYVSGYTLLANVNMEEINYNEYQSTSAGTYAKKYSFTDTESTIANGNFNRLKLSETEVDEFGDLIDEPGVPESWTKSSSTESNIISGVIDTTNMNLLSTLGLSYESIYSSPNWNKPFPVDFGAPNLLMIKTKPSEVVPGDGEGEEEEEEEVYDGTIEPFGYTSSEMSLSTYSYYLIRVYVKTIDGASASIHFSPTTNTNPDNYVNIDTNNEWEEFVFVVETGRTAIKAKLDLFLGNKGSDTKVSGSVFFDSASYQSIEEDYYDALASGDDIIALSYEVDTFDDVKTSSNQIPSPNNWKGSAGNTSLPTGVNNIQSGVLSRISGDSTDFGVQDAEGNIIEGSKIDNDDMTNIIFNDNITTIGENVLFINNKVPSAYAYKTSSSQTLTKASYYEISVWVLTYYIDEDKGARVMLSMGEDTFSFNDINTSNFEDDDPAVGEWTKYTYYIKTAETANTSSTYLTLGLGRYVASNVDDNLVSGYAFFDNYVVKEIEEDAFNNQKSAFDTARAEEATDEEKAFLDYNRVILVDEPQSSTPSDPTDEPDPEEEPEGSNFQWLLITSLILGAVVVLTVVIVIIKRVSPKIMAKRKTKFKKSSYDRTAPKDKTTTKSKRYDKYKDE